MTGSPFWSRTLTVSVTIVPGVTGPSALEEIVVSEMSVGSCAATKVIVSDRFLTWVPSLTMAVTFAVPAELPTTV